ncbi:sodium- and chloride-dependent glycine transporter 1-like isoform X2 [Colias croceus]|uniref:sodium- and chloride-dependent glycine transporter 1-like isoform X2 n=2 Tax=Colias crocea TaxID=72248 RepID=UPI001E27EE62|nr:sodium- and chloride-dependent glycine transporter 1-like isoform X2 [Colias croceus]
MESRKRSKTSISTLTKNKSEMDNTHSDCSEVMLKKEEQNQEETEPERGNWTGRFDFLLSLLGYSVGLGNVWRFPYLCYNNGGGAFLIPFTVMLIIAGLPLMFMELSFGQYAALGPVAVYNRFCPLFRGLGYGMVIVSSIVMLYYNIIIAWTFYYIYVSFVSIFYQLPWQNCDADWSTEFCYSYEAADECEANNGTYYLRQCFNQTQAVLHNITALVNVTLRRPPAEEYFSNHVLGLSSGIQQIGGIRWSLAACLFAAWVIVFLCLCKGVQSSGKVVYFTALFPYVVLVILFFRGVTLPGASTGILFYLTPDFSQLANAQVWGDAAVQIFFALSPAWGGLITLSSYNKFSNNCYLDSLIVAVSNIATSFFAGLVIFSVIGFLAHELHVSVDRVVDQGAGLAFIVYPEVVTRLPLSPLWSILFFFMLLTLGLDSQFALMETVTTAILDRFPNFRERKVWVVLTVAVFGYLGGLIFTTNSGMYWLQLMDKYAANWSVLIIAIGECILIAWIYGAEKFCHDIERMIGRQSKTWLCFWSTMWRGITPAALIFILAFNWIEYKPATYGHYVYPMWADAVGWIIGMLPILVVVLMAIDKICTGPDDLTIMQKARFLSQPTDEWGPAQRSTVVLPGETELSPPVLLLHGRHVLRERGA